MSVAFFIVTEREVEGLETFVNGKAIAKVSDKAMRDICTSAGVKSIYDFVSADPEELAEVLGDEGAEETESLPAEQWFAPEEGLEWTKKLSAYLNANPTVIKGTSGVLSDLTEYEEVFKGLQSHGVRWHFAVDF